MTENQIIYSVTGDEDGIEAKHGASLCYAPLGGIKGCAFGSDCDCLDDSEREVRDCKTGTSVRTRRSNADDPKTTNTEGEHK